MAVSAKQLQKVAQDVLQSACSSPESWVELMRVVTPFYKYDISNALLIAAQRPDATACATMRQWNRHNLWIRKGSKAIYTIDPQNPYYAQRVFDISDINAPPEKLPEIWQLREDERSKVFGRLREEWNDGSQDYDDSLKLYELILDAAALESPSYRDEFEDARSMSSLADLTPDDAENIFISLAANSAYLIASHRLGMDIPDEITMDMFNDILYFDTPATRMAIANAAHETAEAVLRQIEREVRIVDFPADSRIMKL